MKNGIAHRLVLALTGALLASGVPVSAETVLQVDDSRSVDGAIAIATDEWKLVFSEFFNGGIHQWYDLTLDPGEIDNLTTASGGGNYNTGTLFDYDVYTGFGFNQINEFMTTVGRNASPGALEFELLENTPARVRILQSGHPRLNNGTGPPGDPFLELRFVDVSTIWTLYPTGRVGIEFRADRNPGAEIVDSGPGGAGKGVERLSPPFENRVRATGGTDFLAVFATAGDTIESPGGGWGPLHIVQRMSSNQLILEQDIPAGIHDFVIRRDEVRLETISIHADGDPGIVNQCSDLAVSRWQGGSDANPLWNTPMNDGCGTLSAGTGQNTLLAHWTRDRGAGSLLAFFEPWVEQTSGFFNDTGFTDISYTQAGRAGFWSFEPHHRHFLAQMGSSTGAVLPTIKSVADAQPRADDYRIPFAEALVGTLATGPEIATHGFNPGTAAYEVTATADAAVVRFDANGGGRAGFAYFAPAVLLRGYGVDDTRVSVEISSDGGNAFAPLAPSLYNLTTRDDEAELGADTRLFQYLGEIPGTATGSSAFAFRFSREDPACDDGVDNDGDGLIDFPSDPGCNDGDDVSEEQHCSDSLDNDGDGFTDFVGGDSGCTDPDDPSENDPSLRCDDGIDNDGDGSTDFPSDAGCEDLLDNTEAPDPMEAEAKVKIRLKFNKPSRDKMQVKVKDLQLPESVVPTEVTVNVGGAECTGTLDAKGKFKSPDGRDSITMKQSKKTQLWGIAVNRKKNDFAADLWDEGCTDSDNPRPGTPVTVPLTITVGGVAYGQDVDLVYKSKAGKKGIAK